jgi:hypothetical protein
VNVEAEGSRNLPNLMAVAAMEIPPPKVQQNSDFFLRRNLAGVYFPFLFNYQGDFFSIKWRKESSLSKQKSS